MKKIILNAKPRAEKEKRDLSLWVKGVIYGPEMKESKSVWVLRQEFKKVHKEAGGSTLVDFKIEGDDQDYSVLFNEIQYDSLTEALKHIDFYKVKMGEKIDTEIELNFIGESPAVKELGGILIKGQDSLDVRCFPRDLIGSIEVDLGELKTMEDCIYVKDLKIPATIEVITNPEISVASLDMARSEEELEKLDEKVEMDVDKIEVEKGEKTEEEGGGEEKNEDEKSNNKNEEKNQSASQNDKKE